MMENLIYMITLTMSQLNKLPPPLNIFKILLALYFGSQVVAAGRKYSSYWRSTKQQKTDIYIYFTLEL